MAITMVLGPDSFSSDRDCVLIWRLHGPERSLGEAWQRLAMDSEAIACVNWDLVLARAVEAMARPDWADELRRILRELAPSVARSKDVLPQSRAEALQVIAILISLMSLWIAMHQGDQKLSSQDAHRLGHAIAVEEERVRAEHASHKLCKQP